MHQSNENQNPELNYFVTIPADLILNEKFTHMEIILMGIINGLANSKGYAWASNAYLAKLSRGSERWVSDTLGKLQEEGLVNVVIEGTQRKIWIASRPQKTKTDPVKKPINSENPGKPPVQNRKRSLKESLQDEAARMNQEYANFKKRSIAPDPFKTFDPIRDIV